jgi:hypothetical protein
MRLFCLIAILFVFFTPIKPHASEQYDDLLIHNGKEYLLEDVHGFEAGILQPYLEGAKKWKWWDYFSLQFYLEKVNKLLLKFYISVLGWCSALARGYYVTLEIVNNKLVLKDISNCDGKLFFFKVKGPIFKMDWFTDLLFIGEGASFYGFHEHYSVFHFEKGMLVKEERAGYEEYVRSIPKELLYGWDRDFDKFEHYLETEKEDKSEFLAKLKAEYEKKFGEPISDFELTIQEIRFRNKRHTVITRTLYGARATYDEEEIKLNIEEWLDFVRALSTCCLDKWEKKIVPYDPYSGKGGVLYVDFSSKGKPYVDHYEFPIKDTELPNLKEFEKVMEDMAAKIRK